ncbi:MAG: hypothetical protein U1E56_04590 [Bauldia sp.]
MTGFPAPRQSVAMVFCIEPGRLEAQARLLAASVRQFGGGFAGCELIAVQPRGVEALTAATQSAFAELGVRHLAGRLNVDHADVPTANKVYAIDAVSAQTDSDFLVFLDSDTVVVNEPALFVLPEGVDLGLRPTVRKFRGSSGPRDRADRFWQRLFSAAGVAEPGFVRTVADKVLIRGYYNAGLAVMRRRAGLAKGWLEHLRCIDKVVVEGRNNLDQFALATLAAKAGERVGLLPFTYNYPINRRAELVGVERNAPLRDLVHIHYHEAFCIPDFLRRARPALEGGDERFRWLEERLPLPPVVSTPWRPAKRLPRRLAARIRLAADRWKGTTFVRQIGRGEGT